MEQTQVESVPDQPNPDELPTIETATTTTMKPLTSDKNIEESSNKADEEAEDSMAMLTESAADKKLFSTLSEDTEIPLSALGVTAVADSDTFLSDDENRVLLTLETTNNGNTEESPPTERNGSLADVAIATNQLQSLSEAKTTSEVIVSSFKSTSTITVLSDTIITPASKIVKGSAKPESSLLKGMQHRLAKTVELKSATTGIEIPHELISTGLVSPPIILNTQVSKPTLQSQDLIKILEGDDDIEPADELKAAEHYVGGHEDEDGDELLEQIQISIVGEDGVVKDISLMATSAPDTEPVEQRDTTREIAMRQIMNLPRKHKRKMKLEEKHDLEDDATFLNNSETPNESDSSKNDLISSLVSDWSDNEAKGEEPPAKKATASKQKPPSKVALALAKTVPIVPAKSIFSSEKVVKPKARRPAPQKVAIPAINTSPIKIINKSVVPEALPPFKRSRVIKKKIIWDPDAPETQVSYASLIGNTTVKKISPVKATHTITRLPTPAMRTSTPKTTVAATLAKIPATITVKSAAKPTEPAIAKPMTAVEASNLEDTIEVIVGEKAAVVIPINAEKKKIQARAKKEPKEKKEPVKRKRLTTAASATSQSPTEVPVVGCSPTAVKKKKLSEIDKLLGDEGAINMMYSLEKDNVELENMNTDDDKLGAKTRVIRNVVINKSISPNTTGRSRPKRDVTPVKHLLVEKQQDILLHKQMLQLEKQQAVAAAAVATPEVAVKKPAATRKKTAAKKNDSWDYVYAQRNDDSMIIRRRSNSSYSSTTSPRRLSLDLSNQTSDQGTSANASMDGSDGKFEFLKPTNKKMPMKNEDVKVNASLVSEMKGKLTKVMKRKAAAAAAAVTAAEDSTVATDQDASPPPAPSARKSRAQSAAVTKAVAAAPAVATQADKPKIITTTSLKEITVHHHENVVEISIKATAKAKNCFTVPMMQEISAILNTLTTSNRCKVVVLWAKLGTFGNGIDYSQLVQPSVEKRKVAAQELYTTLR
jgi:hypothetical protein